MRPWIVLAAALPLLIGCVDRGNAAVPAESVAAPEAEEPSPETYALGTAVTTQGAIPVRATGEQFLRGGDVYLSVDVSGASTDQHIEVKWIDPHGRVLRRDERHATRGTQHVPFSSGSTSQWTRGAHRAVIMIDGRTVSEKRFAVM